ncbi:MAG: hypothetical protein KF754_02650 [Planctomycetes bacterium]|nr:hypothetical protein [Planctomycetota bacterium]
MKIKLLALCLATLALLGGCAEHKEYHYRDYPMSREDMYDAMVSVLKAEGYEIKSQEENFVNGMPRLEIETDWNMRYVGSVYKGNDVRHRAYVRITTLYTERDEREFQPLSPDDGKRIKEQQEEQRKKADMEQTRLGIAVTREHRDAIDRVLEAEWIYDGPDNLTAAQLLGRFEAIFGGKKGGGARPSNKGARLHEEGLRIGDK